MYIKGSCDNIDRIVISQTYSIPRFKAYEMIMKAIPGIISLKKSNKYWDAQYANLLVPLTIS